MNPTQRMISCVDGMQNEKSGRTANLILALCDLQIPLVGRWTSSIFSLVGLLLIGMLVEPLSAEEDAASVPVARIERKPDLISPVGYVDLGSLPQTGEYSKQFVAILDSGFPIDFAKVDKSCNCATVKPTSGTLVAGEPFVFQLNLADGSFSDKPESTGSLFLRTFDGRLVARIDFKGSNEHLLRFSADFAKAEIEKGATEFKLEAPMYFGSKVSPEDLIFAIRGGDLTIGNQEITGNTAKLGLKACSPINRAFTADLMVANDDGQFETLPLRVEIARSADIVPKIVRFTQVESELRAFLFVRTSKGSESAPLLDIEGSRGVSVKSIRQTSDRTWSVTLLASKQHAENRDSTAMSISVRLNGKVENFELPVFYPSEELEE